MSETMEDIISNVIADAEGMSIGETSCAIATALRDAGYVHRDEVEKELREMELVGSVDKFIKKKIKEYSP